MRAFIRLLYVLSAVPAAAHSDPRGEKNPVMIPDAKGHFRVFFNYADENYRSPMSLLLAEDGRELIPRHRLSASALKAFGITDSLDSILENGTFSQTCAPTAQVLQVPGEKGIERLILEEPQPASGTAPAGPVSNIHVLFNAIGLERLAEFTVAAGHVAVVSALYQNETSPPAGMILRCCPLKGGTDGVQVKLSSVATIYDLVRTSRPVWAGGRFWIAWIRQLGTEEAPAWTTVLTGLDPVTGIAESHDLPGISNWNTGIGLAVNANLVLCAAWAPSVDGSYPGRARVVTAVHPLKPAVPPWR